MSCNFHKLLHVPSISGRNNLEFPSHPLYVIRSPALSLFRAHSSEY